MSTRRSKSLKARNYMYGVGHDQCSHAQAEHLRDYYDRQDGWNASHDTSLCRVCHEARERRHEHERVAMPRLLLLLLALVFILACVLFAL